MSTKYSCVKCGCTIAIDDENLSVINDEIFCPECNHWSKYIATTTPDHAQVVDVVVLETKYYCLSCDHQLAPESLMSQNEEGQFDCPYCNKWVNFYVATPKKPTTPTTDNHSDHYQVMHEDNIENKPEMLISEDNIENKPGAKNNEYQCDKNTFGKIIEELIQFANSKQNRAKRLRRKRRGVQKNRAKRRKK